MFHGSPTRGEKAVVIAFHDQFLLERFRPLTFMLIEPDVGHVAPAKTYRVLKSAGHLDRCQDGSGAT